MVLWWEGLSALNRAFYVVAVFFSTVFVWQFVSAFGSLAGAGTPEVGHGDTDVPAEMGHGDMVHADSSADSHDMVDHAPGLATFRLLSVRSIVAFGTLFSWGGALYLGQDVSQAGAILRAGLWGLAGMLVVALFFWTLPRLSETGTADLNTAINRTAEGYLNIPRNGAGQVKVIVSGALRFVRARSQDGGPLMAGTQVMVVGRIDDATLKVREIDSKED